MPDIVHQFRINADAGKVFAGVSTPKGLDNWWTKRSEGKAAIGEEYVLWFGPGYDWRGVVSRCVAEKEFALDMVEAMDDWKGTRVAFELKGDGGATDVVFRHTNWPVANEHFQISSFCWAMYLRLLKQYVEHGEVVPYDKRLDA